MGFPGVVYSEIPSLLLSLLFLLAHLRRVSTWLLRLAGADVVTFDYPATTTSDDHAFADHHHHVHPASSGALLDLDEHCPAVRFDELAAADGTPLPEGCAVCLGDFRGAARVRRPRACRHVFHRGCLDRWAAHGHRTCPLCRAPLLLLPPARPSPGPVPLPVMPLHAS
uniref:Uncharacterized protein n=1 Tax=Avena sativa TaxID=4498 RepID=A0ACD5Y0N4_AVESA